MNRVSTAVPKKARRKRLFKNVKGFRGRRKNCFSISVLAKKKSIEHSFVGRKLRKRVMRRRWIQMISIWSRLNGMNYSTSIKTLQDKYGDRKAIYAAIKERYAEGDQLAANLVQAS